MENFGFLELPVNCFSGNCQIAMVMVSKARVGAWSDEEKVLFKVLKHYLKMDFDLIEFSLSAPASQG